MQPHIDRRGLYEKKWRLVSDTRRRILSALRFTSPRLRNPAHAYIDFRDLIPGWIVHDTRLGQVKDPLEGAHGVCGAAPVDADV